tara:strand:+ start:1301 stop:1549 length:249 start_codon:yes stop_codon:yes gene_type:complete
MTNAAFLAELRDAARINEIQEQGAEMLDAVREASKEVAQYEWTEEAIAWEEGMHPDNLYDGEPVMDLPNDLYMVFDDPDYWG